MSNWVEIPAYQDEGIRLVRESDINEVLYKEFIPEYMIKERIVVIIYLKSKYERFEFEDLDEGYIFYEKIKKQLKGEK